MWSNVCKFFNSIQNETCEVGCNYVELARLLTKKEQRWHYENYANLPIGKSALAKRIPCFAENKVGGCDKYMLPTLEELQADKQATDTFITKALQNFVTIRPLIEADIKAHRAQKIYRIGQITCPVCQNKLDYSYAGHVNGHIHARCQTEGCAQWIE